MSNALTSLKTANDVATFVKQTCDTAKCIVPGPARPLPSAYSGKEIAFIDLSQQNNVIEHSQDDQVISVQCGMSLNALQELLSKHKQWFPVESADDKMTIGELINRSEGGCLEHGFGGPRELVLGLTVVLANGEVIRCGGKVVKNVTGYDLQKLFIGSHGHLGIVVAANLRLFALPESTRLLMWSAENVAKLIDVASQLIDAGIPMSCLELVNTSMLEQSGRPLVTAAGAYRLLLRLQGHQSVIDELTVKADHIAQKICGTASTFKDSDVALWKALSAVSLPGSIPVTVSIAPSVVPQLLNAYSPDGGWPALQYRPARSKMRLWARNIDRVKDLSAVLSRFGEQVQPIAIAHEDERYEYAVHRFPPEDAGAAALKKSIKEGYDSKSCLNPLVSL